MSVLCLQTFCVCLMSVNTLRVRFVLSFHQSCVSCFKFKGTKKPSLAKNQKECSTTIESCFSNIRTCAIPEAKGVSKAHWVETFRQRVQTYSRCASLKDRGETRKCTGLPYTIRACADVTLVNLSAEQSATRLMRVCNDLEDNSGRHKTQSRYCPEVDTCDSLHFCYLTTLFLNAPILEMPVSLLILELCARNRQKWSLCFHRQKTSDHYLI
uniref:Secreted protein n=1 Tax=Rhipicephalus zambeziensis TaxID=60191 RepID=A0A224YGC4_9ACAR